MKRLPTISLFVLLLVAFRADCRIEFAPAANIQQEFVRFDQAFLPVWYAVTEGNAFEAKRAVFHLGYHWQQLRLRYERYIPDPLWQNTFLKLDKQLSAAFYAVDANNFEQAFICLEAVKNGLRGLRTTYRIEYYLDYLYDLQTTASALNEVVEDEMLDMLAWEDVMVMVVALNRQWSVVQTKRFDPDLYELDSNQLWKWRVTKQSVTDAIDEVNAAMDGADRSMVAEASENLNLAVQEVLRLFGNFEAAATYYANAQ